MASVTLRVVFDTNVLLSLFVFADSRFAPLRGEVVCGRWIALTSPACLAEFRRVLGYPLFALNEERQESAYAAYLALVRMVDALPLEATALPRCQDRDDQKFLELARTVSFASSPPTRRCKKSALARRHLKLQSGNNCRQGMISRRF
jgi:predicted nucleic acid-binding protein